MPPLSCRKTRSLLTALSNGELDQRLAERMQAHLTACESCAEEQQLFQMAVRSLAWLEEQPVPPGFRQGVHARIAAAEQAVNAASSRSTGRDWRPVFLGGRRPAWATALAVGVGVVLVGVWWRWEPRPVSQAVLSSGNLTAQLPAEPAATQAEEKDPEARGPAADPGSGPPTRMVLATPQAEPAAAGPRGEGENTAGRHFFRRRFDGPRRSLLHPRFTGQPEGGGSQSGPPGASLEIAPLARMIELIDVAASRPSQGEGAGPQPAGEWRSSSPRAEAEPGSQAPPITSEPESEEARNRAEEGSEDEKAMSPEVAPEPVADEEGREPPVLMAPQRDNPPSPAPDRPEKPSE